MLVKAVHEGWYTEMLNAAVAAYRAKQPPHVQVYEVGARQAIAVVPSTVYPRVSAHKGSAGSRQSTGTTSSGR